MIFIQAIKLTSEVFHGVPPQNMHTLLLKEHELSGGRLTYHIPKSLTSIAY